LKEWPKTLLFLLLVFGISYGLAGLFYISGGEYGSTWGIVLASTYMFIPLISALVVEKGIHKQTVSSLFRMSFRINRWFFVAWLSMPILSFLAMGSALLVPGVTFDAEMSGMFERFSGMMSPDEIEKMRESIETLPMHPLWITLGQGLLAGITINAVAGFGEEVGWRAFLLNQFRPFSFLKASLLIGFIWGIWHAPLILMGHNYPTHPEWGVLMMTLFCILLSPLFIYVSIKARSVIAAAIMHGSLNATVGIAIMMLSGGNDLLVGLTGLAGFAAIAFLILLMLVYDRWFSQDKICSSRIGDHW